jgi:hypothetical protein
MAIKRISFAILTFRWNKELFFADFGWHFFCVLIKISKKLGVMQKSAISRKLEKSKFKVGCVQKLIKIR